MHWTITETDDGRSFLFTKFSVIDFFPYRKKGIFSCTRPKSACSKSSSSRFSFSATRNTIIQVKDLTFSISFRILFYFPFLGNFEWHRSLELRIFLFFLSSHNSRKSRHITLDWERSSLCHSFINLTQLIGDIKQM